MDPLPASVPVDQEALSQLRALLSQGPPLVLTGAGVSTASGIPDYRGPDGLRRVQPMQYADFLASAQARHRYWARSYLAWPRFSAARPNDTHALLAHWQRAGRVGPVVTQNVDGLHQRAGATQVVELHGSLGTVLCLDCTGREPREELQSRLRILNPDLPTAVRAPLNPDGDVHVSPTVLSTFVAPHCRVCGSDRLKPDVVFFGGSVPAETVAQVYALVESAPWLWVMGSSLQVMSGLRFVKRAHGLGIPVAVLTRGVTRGDPWATVRLDARLDDVLPRLRPGRG